jgi:hypothetical protein
LEVAGEEYEASLDLLAGDWSLVSQKSPEQISTEQESDFVLLYFLLPWHELSWEKKRDWQKGKGMGNENCKPLIDSATRDWVEYRSG